MNIKNKNNFLADIEKLKNKLGKKWLTQIALIEELGLKKNLFITLLGDEILPVGTFGEDNMHKMAEFLLFLLKYQKPIDFKLVMFVRQFDYSVMRDGIPLKNVSGCCLVEEGVFPLSKIDVEESSTTDAETGEKMEKEFQVSYFDFNVLLGKIRQEKTTLQ